MDSWSAVILAAGRGPDDPMAKAFAVTHKCALPVHGKPMLARVVEALQRVGSVTKPFVAIESLGPLEAALGGAASTVVFLQSQHSAPSSVLYATNQIRHYPLLVTTGDHALLTPDMVQHFLHEASRNGADFSVGLASAETILAEYPQSVRTFFKFGTDRVSGCNLFAIMNPKGLRVIERWQYLDNLRKKPWRLVAAFGPWALFRFATGQISLQTGFELVSKRLNAVVKPVLMPFAEAAIDVDKPADLTLAEDILRRREG